MLKASYSYRLERPEYRDLNPFVNLTDPHTILTGNPMIQPEIGHEFQLAYHPSFGKQNSLNFVLFYTRSSPVIKLYTRFYPVYKVGDSLYTNVNVTTRDDIAAETRIGANLSGSFLIVPNLTLHTNMQAFTRQIKNSYAVPVISNGFEYRVNGNLTYQISKEWVSEAFGNYNSGVHWQGRQPSFSSYTVALRKTLFNGKGSLGFTAVNTFSKYLTQTTRQEGPGFTALIVRQIPYRSFGLSFVYKFGNVKFVKPNAEEDYLTKPPVEN